MVNETDERNLSYTPLETSDPAENLEALVKHQELFIQRDKQIEKAVESALENYEMQNVPGRLHTNIVIAITGTEETSDYGEDDWESLNRAIIAYIHSLILMNAEFVEELAEYDGSSGIQHFLIDSILDYGPDMQRMNFHNTQGKDWWSFIQTERVIKEGTLKHTHTFTIDRQRDVNIDSSAHSDWVLIEHFLSEMMDAIEIAFEQPDKVINPEYFKQVRGQMIAIEEAVKQSGMDIEMEDREEIVEELLEGAEERDPDNE
ncbi:MULTISPECIES: hypothetical protein [Halorubrum]|uniref:Uncharacterized protein n=1 Tax=Halorubrum distributum JCM 13916 TaxID=1230455 RepID=M0PSU0_9EURY|nr:MULTISPECIES: hypothetical protein [Halorubrum]EMA72649.1 hypothetical protein C462_00816 [Halorubrum arcis JCM 13916]